MKITLTKEENIKETWYYVTIGDKTELFNREDKAREAYAKAVRMQKHCEVTILEEYDSGEQNEPAKFGEGIEDNLK